MINEHEIQNRLWAWRNQNHRFVVPNVYMPWGESDLLTVTKAGFVYDHEIKISRRDFNADTRTKETKHFNMRVRETRFSPNYFVFAVPHGLVNPDEVPEYAGLVYIDPESVGCGVTVVKSPPRLHTSRASHELVEKLCTKLMWRYWRVRLGERTADAVSELVQTAFERHGGTDDAEAIILR